MEEAILKKPAKIITIMEYKTFIWGGAAWLLFGLALYFVIIPSQIAFSEAINNTSPRTVPHILSGMFTILGPLLIYHGFKMREKTDQKIYELNLHQIRLVFFTLLIISANIVAFNYIGYMIPAILTMAALMLTYGNRSYIKIALYSIITPTVIYFFFKHVMQMYLPNPFAM